MKVLLVYPNIVESPKDISLGLAIISSLLKQHKHEVELIDTTFTITDEEIIQKAKQFFQKADWWSSHRGVVVNESD